jgi:hypothetical protein
MFTIETIMAILRVIPGFLEIIVRYCHELATHAIGIISAL